jgi:hypothetical protein
MGVTPSSLSAYTSLSKFFSYRMSTSDPISTADPMSTRCPVSAIVSTQRPHSMRKRAWYVSPVNTSTSCVDETIRSTNWLDKQGKVLCGHLFNAAVERDQLGLVVGAGEECPISLEPIADARLSFADKIRVESNNRELTGVELLCGHRFSAVFLLWHWVRSPMICPICRAEYSLKTGTIAGRLPVGHIAAIEEPRACKLENFPYNHWKKLRAVMRVHAKEEEEEERRLIASYHAESIVDETLEVVLGPAQQFFLMLSLEDHSGPNVVQYMPLVRTNDNMAAITDDTFRFSIQRSSLRRFTSLMSNISRTQPLNQYCEPVRYNLMRASVVLRVGVESDEQSYLFRVAQMADIVLPAFRGNQEGIVHAPTPVVDDVEVDAVEVDAVEVDAVEVDAVDVDVVAVDVDAVEVDAVEVDAVEVSPELSVDEAANILTGLGHISTRLVVDMAMVATVVVGAITGTTAVADTPLVSTRLDNTELPDTAVLPEDQHTEAAPATAVEGSIGLNRPIAVPMTTTTDSLASVGNLPENSRTSIVRYTTVAAPCIDMRGLLTLEICEGILSEGIQSLHSGNLTLRACSLMSEVARCFSQ